ncbi:MAG: prephenate dehydrogenase [Haliscomenobacteraceae bacterium CHB4]|nr:Cyclohexadienyl dehydrogenase [Saprospiraceae bacterium]MCE7923583.1 prephenate dehydrogenase [Haliscomenobacteraceae bacterium CHB4]
MIVTIIGPGLIGGSIAIGLRESGFSARVIGVDNNPAHAARAVELGLVDEVRPLEEAVQKSRIIVVATPVDSLTKLLPHILNIIDNEKVVLDVGSTKTPILAAVENHPNRARFVATHPMAGTEYSGPEAAIPGLFAGKCCVFTDIEKSAPDALGICHQLYAALGMRITTLGGNDHDLHVAYVSHISHIASFALALTVLEKEKDEDRIFELASGGFQSTVRLAKSSPETWIPIFRQNRDNVLDVLDEFINTVSRFRTLLIKKDFGKFEELIRHANDIRRIIDPK